MNTHETFVSLETARLLKGAGFDWECRKCYNHGVMFDMESDEIRKQCPQHSQWDILAPTLAVAQRWLREVKGYILEITAVRKNPDDVYKTYIEYWYNIFEKGKCGHYDTYEQAQEAGEKKALELILEKGE